MCTLRSVKLQINARLVSMILNYTEIRINGYFMLYIKHMIKCTCNMKFWFHVNIQYHLNGNTTLQYIFKILMSIHNVV